MTDPYLTAAREWLLAEGFEDHMEFPLPPGEYGHHTVKLAELLRSVAAPLTWSSEAPKVPGYYWQRLMHHWCSVVSVYEEATHWDDTPDGGGHVLRSALYVGHDPGCWLTECDPRCQWAGPLPLPVEAP